MTASLGGLTFLNRDTLLIGGNANTSSGYISQIGVSRDGDGHIVGFSGPASFYATAPNIDGGLAFGPDGVLFATGYSNNTLLQIKPGSTSPDKIVRCRARSVRSARSLSYRKASRARAQ